MALMRMRMRPQRTVSVAAVAAAAAEAAWQSEAAEVEEQVAPRHGSVRVFEGAGQQGRAASRLRNTSQRVPQMPRTCDA